ncbi:MAG TPA: hypothetical protein VGF56_05730 [Rhizomicrobium sp.]|jgi:hypothetical protein
MIETFQNTLFPSVGLQWALAGTVVTGGQPISGPPPAPDISGGGWWTAQCDIKLLTSTAEIRMWRALAVRLGSGAVPIVVPVIDVAQPWPAGFTGAALVPHSDGSPFSDGSLYETGIISYAVTGDASLRATSMQVTRSMGSAIKGGEFFTLTGPTYGDRLYLIGAVTDVDGDLFSISFLPPLREDYADGTFADFQKPRCTMKLSASALSSIWPKIERPYRGQPSITFEETFS